DEPWSAELLEPLAENPRLHKLGIAGTGIGDLEIPTLLQCRHLRSIDVTATKITAKGVKQLLALPGLAEIRISETAVSAELREQATAAGVRLDILKVEPSVRPKFNSGFGGGPPDSPK